MFSCLAREQSSGQATELRLFAMEHERDQLLLWPDDADRHSAIRGKAVAFESDDAGIRGGHLQDTIIPFGFGLEILAGVNSGAVSAVASAVAVEERFGGAFVHEKYARNKDLIRLGGWWGNDEASRFKMEKGFVPKPTAEGWSMSTAQVFNMVSLRSSLALFEEAGIENLQAKSRELTGYLFQLLKSLNNLDFEILTPAEPHRRGAQLSLYFKAQAKAIHQKIIDAGVVVDYREPGVVRVAPAPLYNSFEDVHRFYHILESL